MPWSNLKAGGKDLGQFDEGFCAQLDSFSDKMVICFSSDK